MTPTSDPILPKALIIINVPNSPSRKPPLLHLVNYRTQITTLALPRFVLLQPNSTTVELKVIDISGKMLMQQVNKVTEGNNSVAVNNPDKLQPGIYLFANE